MKYPTITSLGLAVLAGVSLVTPASATMASLDYSGYFSATSGFRDSTGSLTPFNQSTAFSMTATFDEATRQVGDTWTFTASTLSFVIGENNYTATYPTDMTVMLADSAMLGMGNVVGLSLGEPSANYFGSGFADPQIDWANPLVSTDFSGFDGNIWGGTKFNITLDGMGDLGGLAIKGVEGNSTASLSMSAIPEPTSMLSTLALVFSGLLLRRRTKALL
jgi:hypothetical protein